MCKYGFHSALSGVLRSPESLDDGVAESEGVAAISRSLAVEIEKNKRERVNNRD